MVGTPGEAGESPTGAEAARDAVPAAPPAGLYVHVPFCARVCPYCDFAVQTGGPQKRAAYAEAIVREIRWWGDETAAAKGEGDPGHLRGAFRGGFDTVYLGGGTPSTLSRDALAEIMASIRDELGVRAGAEITLEANPEDVDEESAAGWRELGITRLSLGVQSFDDEALRVLGRSHDAGRAEGAVRCAQAAGFDTVSVDLIFAAPGLDNAAWMATLRRAVELRPEHISCYELTVHEGTRFFRERERGRLTEQPDDAKAEQFFAAHDLLTEAGYDAYEVSNFARDPGHHSRHNAKYWNHSAYLGIGPSAHSFDGTSRRWWNARRLRGWMQALGEQGAPPVEQESLAPTELALEALALGFRTTRGVDLAALTQRTGLDLAPANRGLIDELAAEGLIRVDAGRLLPTRAGLALADTLARRFEIPPVGMALADEPPLAAAEGAPRAAAASERRR